ncbi:MAG: isoleucine--tRNA ligase [Verrucomicrobiaceae bacterium]|nr:isoleucine--tRNA ligase [Verrucomicrobiaceae bacterium]
MSEKDFKNTLNLPSTKFPMRGDLVKREPSRIEHWQKNNLYKKIQQKNADKPKFILHDGPPFTNGDVHIGTALNKILKDVILRYKSMKGFSTPYVPGWDCHGLPIEHKVAKMLREENRQLSTAELREECANFSASYMEKQRRQFVRLGILADWEREYKTKDPAYEADILRTFASFVRRGLVYRSKKPVYWSIPCATALAEAEIEYKDHTSSSIWVAFKLDDQANVRLGLTDAEIVIWTTTPWTMPSNLAMAVNPEIEYVAVSSNGRTFIVGAPLAESFIKACDLKDAEVKSIGKGSDIEGISAYHPFCNRKSTVYCARYVTTDSGTGVVHIAPGHGLEDYQVGLEHGLDIYCPLDDEGKYVDDGQIPAELVGISVLENESGRSAANGAVLEILNNKGALLKIEKIAHQYPHCWRSKTPVIFRAMDQWFVALDKDNLRNEALDAISSVEWLPARGENRIRGAVESRPDWCISRQRAWGVPIPAFYGKDKQAFLDADVIEAIADKVESYGTNFWYNSSEEEILKDIKFPENWGNASDLKKGTDTLDVWIDSGSSHIACLSRHDDLSWPADLYFEGSDQHRGWFQSSLWTAIATKGKAPYKRVITHGFIVDEHRKKISKSDGKPQTADMYVGQWGADIVRMWISSVDYQNDMPISEGIMKNVANAYRGFRNTIMYQLGNLSDFNKTNAVAVEKLDAIDKWAVVKAAEFACEVDKAYEAYEFHKVYKLIDNFCGVTLSRIYHDILKDRLYTFGTNSFERRSSQTAMDIISDILIKVASPILTFTCDEAFSFKNGGEYIEDSIHLQDFPKYEELLTDTDVVAKVDRILQLRDLVNEELEKLRQNKVIGKSLEAEVEIMVAENSNDANILKEFERSLAEIFIVSDVRIVVGKFETPAVQAHKAEGERCVRCWRVVKSLNDDGICSRCEEAISNK